MGTVISYSEHKRRAKGGRLRFVDPLIAETLEALLALGGCAHRQAVADLVAQRRSGRSCPAETALRNEVWAAVDAYLAQAASRKTPPLLERPLGAGSYRWALTEAGRGLFDVTPPVARMVR